MQTCCNINGMEKFQVLQINASRQATWIPSWYKSQRSWTKASCKISSVISPSYNSPGRMACRYREQNEWALSSGRRTGCTLVHITARLNFPLPSSPCSITGTQYANLSACVWKTACPDPNAPCSEAKNSSAAFSKHLWHPGYSQQELVHLWFWQTCISPTSWMEELARASSRSRSSISLEGSKWPSPHARSYRNEKSICAGCGPNAFRTSSFWASQASHCDLRMRSSQKTCQCTCALQSSGTHPHLVFALSQRHALATPHALHDQPQPDRNYQLKGRHNCAQIPLQVKWLQCQTLQALHPA